MRGGVLSVLASAFRLRQVMMTSTAGVSEGAARHGLTDHRDIGHGKHVALLRGLVEQLFSRDYLTARGLDAEEAAAHNELVVGALDAILLTWDRFAAFANVVPEHLERIDKLLGMELGLSVDLPLILVAYGAVYGHLHPCLPHAGDWSKGPGLKRWWLALEGRATSPIKVSKLHGVGTLDSRTVRAFRDGKAVPKEGTIQFLAEQLAKHGIRALGEERSATAAELEFELRVAVAAVQHRAIVERFTVAAPDDAIATNFSMIRSVLEHQPDVSEDLLRRGPASPLWAQIRPAVVGVMVGRVHELAAALASDVSKRLETITTTPQAEWRRMAADCGERASFWRNFDKRPGADGPDKRSAEWFEGERDLWLALAENRLQDVPHGRKELAAEMQADGLCMEAVAPWLNLGPEQQEEKLRQAVRVCDSSPYAHRQLGQHLRHHGRTDEAIRHLRRALELNPQNEESREALAFIYLDRNEFSEALAITNVHPSTLTLRAVRAHALVELGSVAEAQGLALELLDKSPRHPPTLRVLALCHRKTGDVLEAQKLERRADLLERGAESLG